MQHLIIGYGYCGYYLAKALLEQGQQVSAFARSDKASFQLKGLNFIEHDIATQPLSWPKQEACVVYYLVPPPPQGNKDLLLRYFLEQSDINIKTLVYFGSSGVYGDHHGQTVNEESVCNISTPRQLRRLDAEQAVLDYCQQHQTQALLLRIVGIYGPNRLPIEAARNRSATIVETQAPLSNSIAVSDLAEIAIMLAQMPQAQGLFNISDGQRHRHGYVQIKVAEQLKLPKAQERSFEQVFEQASPMKKEFLSASKYVDITKLLDTLGERFKPSPIESHLKNYLDHKELE